ncbi:gas vesicle protein GvpL [Haloarchaeobius sp. HRN-SO-5]|uniref:gas vesicle protein GvpL n=1 Tax=Haloarchaeobius sp. HRN-SO-5 TaxID=3446118 RepID=UPI003EB8B0BD
MSDAGPDADEGFEDGRYLYCVVRVAGVDPDGFAPEGLADEPVRVVTADGLGAVVHTCDSLYDSDDPTTLKRWLLRHQGVTDDAAEFFGTPLPVRFDTVLTGDDEDVRAWLRDAAAELEPALERFAGRREYRVGVHRDEDALADRLAESDDRLAELGRRRDETDEGTSFLVGKQYEKRLSDLVREHREREADALADRLAEYAVEVRRLGRNQNAGILGVEGAGDGDATRFAVLAPADHEDDLGAVLDDVAAADGVEVRFSGPWPPYTFAPEVGGADQ